MPRILQVLNHLDYGGQEKLVVDYLKNINPRYTFIFLTISKAPPYELGEEVLRNNGKIYYIPLNGRVAIAQGNKQRLAKLISDESIDVIHIHPKADYIAKFARQENIPFVVHSHSNFFGLPPGIFKKALGYIRYITTVRKRLRRADMFLACSISAGHFLFGRRPFKVLPNGIPAKEYAFNKTTRLNLRKSYSLLTDDVAILHVGRMAYPKNQTFVIDAFREYALTNPRAKLFLIGDGPDKTKLITKVKSLGLNKKVKFLGSVNSKEFYNMADILLLPSLTEGLGTSLVEAQANGLYSIASAGVPRDVDFTGKIEFMAKRSTPKDWAQVIGRRAKMRFDGENLVRNSEYDIKQTVRQLEAVYDQLTV